MLLSDIKTVCYVFNVNLMLCKRCLNVIKLLHLSVYKF